MEAVTKGSGSCEVYETGRDHRERSNRPAFSASRFPVRPS
jgi:hypothetical protein